MVIDEGRFALEGEVKAVNYTLYGKDMGKVMDRDSAIQIHKQLHEISINHMQELKDKNIKGELLQREL